MELIKTQNKNSRKTDIFVFLLFAFGYIAITIFHEPWFDEAQAWQIGRTASLYDLLFVVPHYEGHPALWTLILAIPARLGVPYEIGLKGIGFLISAASVYLILFRSPFPAFVRRCLPFTYFVFYQYGIIVRPYGLTLLLMLLLAAFYSERHQKPGSTS